MTHATPTPPPRPAPAWLPWAAVLALTALGAWLRLAHLGDRGLPGDELEMWRFCKSGASAWGLLRGEVPSPLMMFMPAMIKAFQEAFGLEPTNFALRFPGAVLGILCIPAACFIGRRLSGAGGGLLTAVLVAIHPVHIQCSMEAYPYILTVLGFALELMAILMALDAWRTDRRIGIGFHILFAVSLVLQVHATISAWPAAALGTLAVLGILFLRGRGGHWRRALAPLLTAVALTALIWGGIAYKVIGNFIDQRSMTYGHAGYHRANRLFDPDGLLFLTNFGWGSTPLRVAATALALGCVGLAVWRGRRAAAVLLPVGLLVLAFAATMVSRYLMGHPFEPRLMIPFFVPYQALLAMGLTMPCATDWLRRQAPLVRGAIGTAWLLLFAIPLLGPASMAPRIQGIPFPYRPTVAWADANLPPGAPVLCERFFDAYNEFVVNPATNVVFMSTIPNEPVERYEQMRFRDTARDFLERNPDAAYYAVDMFWEKLGKWEWPRQYFANVQRFPDPLFNALCKMGLSYRTFERGVDVDELPRAIYYNTPADLVAKARAAGRPALAVYGPGWSYTKTQDYRDWRMMGATAGIAVENLGATTNAFTLEVAAVASGRDKTVTLDGRGAPVRFPANQPVRAAFGPVALPPGRSVLQLTDPRWPQEQTPLLTHEIGIRPVPEPAS